MGDVQWKDVKLGNKVHRGNPHGCMTQAVCFLLWFCLALPALPTTLHPLSLPFLAPDQWFQLVAASFPSFHCSSIDLCDCNSCPDIIIVSIPAPGDLHKCAFMCECEKETEREYSPSADSSIQESPRSGEQFQQLHWVGRGQFSSPRLSCSSLF